MKRAHAVIALGMVLIASAAFVAGRWSVLRSQLVPWDFLWEHDKRLEQSWMLLRLRLTLRLETLSDAEVVQWAPWVDANKSLFGDAPPQLDELRKMSEETIADGISIKRARASRLNP